MTSQEQTVVVVSGLPRSGTSLLMQMLAAAGMPVLADGSRLRLTPGSTLLIGSLHLNEELRRVVKLDLLTGEIEAAVSSGGPG